MNTLKRIISGGQTGVDRAALDWAIQNNIAHDGWCPKGRRAEDGIIPSRYTMQETGSKEYKQRTKWNVRDSDATLIISLLPELIDGSLLTYEYARKIAKPCLHVYPESKWPEQIKIFTANNSIQILNVAGPRRSGTENIEQFVYEILDRVLKATWEAT